jgi:hypothetical protein
VSGAFSNGLESWLVDHVFGGIPYPPPITVYSALYTTAPTQSGGGVEVIGGGYVRMPVTFAPTGGAVITANNVAVQFPAASAAWGTVVAGGLFNDVNDDTGFLGAAMLVDPADMITPLPRPIMPGDIFRIPVGNMVVGFAAPAAGGLARSVMRPIGAHVRRPVA